MRFSTLTALLITSLCTTSSFASVVSTDLDTLNDNLVMTDTDTGLEYLSLTKTINMSANEITALFNTTLSGWRFALSAETDVFLDHLLSSVGGYNATTNSVTYNESIISAHIAAGYTGALVGGSYAWSYGKTMTSSGAFTLDGFRTGLGQIVTFNNWGGFSLVHKHSDYGTWLVRDAQNMSEALDGVSDITSVPAPLALSSLALLGFGLARRNKRA